MMMKRLLLLMMMLLCMVSINAQYVPMDKTEENGSRHIITKAKSIYLNNILIQLDYRKSSNDNESYRLRVTLILYEHKRQIAKGRKLLLKFSDDSVIELKNDTEIGPFDYDMNILYGHAYYYINPDYIITKEQIEEIISKEVAKVRIENNISYIDIDIKKNKFSKAIKDMYSIIKNTLAIERDIYTGF